MDDSGSYTAASLAGVSVEFRTPDGGFLTALEDLNIVIGQREIVCLVGRSGCGKTTVLNLLAGFLRPTAGAVIVAGDEVRTPGPDRPVVFQQPNLFPWLTVMENVTLGSRKRHVKRLEYIQQATYLVDRFGLKDFSDYLPYQLSGGMKQRVQIARALMGSPALLLMDEPFGALDSQTRLAMQEQLLGLRETISCAVLFITHDVDEAVFLGDRVYVMTPRPGRVHSELDVDLPQRDYRVLGSPEFAALKSSVLEILHSFDSQGPSDGPISEGTPTVSLGRDI